MPSLPLDSEIRGNQAPLTCPVCEQSFSGTLPLPAIFNGRESDLRPIFIDAVVDPLLLLIQVCPHCLFAAYPQTFGHDSESLDELAFQCTSSLGDRAPPILDKLDREARIDLQNWLQREDFSLGLRSPAQRYLQAARCHDYVSSDEGAEETALLADYFLRASWAARASGDQVQEFTCRAEALERLWLMADDESLPLMEKVRTLFLLAELSRRQGDFASAIDLFTQLEDISFNPNDQSEAEAEADFFYQQAERLLSLACTKSDVNARVWEPEEDDTLFEGEDDEDEGNGSGPQGLI
ncbi:MAG: DUF2225 domain-containing protein [Myxococcales bacterium]|nr:DUF2225 domain-containing protein [Myxococcales bacterium]